jgi:tetratricopeptide (TPR) repeat protein
LAAPKVKAWQGTITIPTYPWEEDPYPKFWALEESPKWSTTVHGSIVYPYRMQDHLLRTKVDRTYKALFLENEYLKVTCLPELGGRLHSVFDKTEGKEMFHLNRVIKPSMIALRGAFISGGVEWNAGPQGHTVTIVSPVDALVGENPDGSAYIEVNNHEMICRTRWTVRVTLHPGRSYLDEQIRIFNPTDNMVPYYFWNCTAFPNRPGTRFIYPMSLGTDHYGRKFFNWPVHEGKDLSWLKNWETSGSVFAVGCEQDFFGAYDVEADRGIVQVANHHDLPGKKAWTWGNWDFGRVSQQNLTDDDGPYIEVQSGPLPTQSDYGLLGPRDQIAWQEWWYPVHGLGEGFEFANKDVAVQVTRNDGKMELRIIATAEFPGATCELEGSTNNMAWTTKGTKAGSDLALSPSKPQVVNSGKPPTEPVGVWIRTKDRRLLAHFTTPLPIPKTTPPKFVDKPDEQLGAEELYLKGEKLYRAINRRAARAYFEKALAKDPGFVPALRMLAVIDLGAGFNKDALERLTKAVDRQGDDGLAWYFLGVVYLRMEDHDADALRCAYRAARCSGTTAIGYDLAGRAHMRLHQAAQAVEAFRKSLAANPRDTRAKDHLLLALYADGKEDEAWRMAERRVTEDPTDLAPRALLGMRDAPAMEKFLQDARGFVGEHEFNILETSLVFAQAGMLDEAGRLVYAACVDGVPPDERKVMPWYYLAYLGRFVEKGDKSFSPWQAAALKERSALGGYGAAYIFPSRPEELAILQYAVKHGSYANFALGNLLAHFGRVDEAISHWEKGVMAAPAFGRRYRNLPLALWKWKNDLKAAEDYYSDMYRVYGRILDQTLYRDLAEILIARGKRPDAIKLLEAMPSDKPRRSEITIMLAQAYLDEQRYDDAIKLLESTPHFVNWEGQDITWRIFNQAHVKRGQQRMEKKEYEAALQDFAAALTYPANLNVGRSNKPEESPALYWKGKALAALKRPDDARAAWKQGAELPEGSAEQNRHRQLCKEALEQE